MLPDTEAQAPASNPVRPSLTISKVGAALIPFASVRFDTDTSLAVTRLAVYGGLAYLLWKKNKTLAYTALIAGGTCAITSLSGMVYSKA